MHEETPSPSMIWQTCLEHLQSQEKSPLTLKRAEEQVEEALRRHNKFMREQSFIFDADKIIKAWHLAVANADFMEAQANVRMMRARQHPNISSDDSARFNEVADWAQAGLDRLSARYANRARIDIQSRLGALFPRINALQQRLPDNWFRRRIMNRIRLALQETELEGWSHLAFLIEEVGWIEQSVGVEERLSLPKGE